MSIKKPNFFIVGQTRSGTTSFQYELDQHPDIYFLKPEWPKGKGHFGWVSDYKDDDEYLEQFADVNNERRIGERCNAYLYCPYTAERIKQFSPNAKIIMILRNPIDKAYSTYYQQFEFGEYTTSFEETINTEFRRIALNKDFSELNSNNPDFENFVVHNIIRHGIYADYLEHWLEIFNRKQILILNSDDLKKFTKETLCRVFNFLNISNCDITNTSQVNVGKYPPMNKSTRKKLIEFYKPYNQRLNKLLGTNFNWNN